MSDRTDLEGPRAWHHELYVIEVRRYPLGDLDHGATTATGVVGHLGGQRAGWQPGTYVVALGGAAGERPAHIVETGLVPGGDPWHLVGEAIVPGTSAPPGLPATGPQRTPRRRASRSRRPVTALPAPAQWDHACRTAAADPAPGPAPAALNTAAGGDP